ncbi:MAG: molybdate ABC transporter substrate-binding protein [Gammaproteobacteria bacterium]|nr:molybdate ABC transporter substrate-binding protein [Gammaproteobacteria bacterium]
MHGRLFVPALLLALSPVPAIADDAVTVAAASNFSNTARDIVQRYREETGTEVRLVNGSTGKLYAQIINGAPFDVFLAADSERPRLVEASGHGVAGTRMTYAIGALVLWSRDERARDRDCRDLLIDGDYEHLALANPATAPYGQAARETLETMGLWESSSRRAVFGENIAQTLQFVATGNATLGFVAQSQLASSELPDATCAWRVPLSLHSPLEQQLVLLTRSENNPSARRFVEFMGTPAAREIIVQQGYRVAER